MVDMAFLPDTLVFKPIQFTRSFMFTLHITSSYYSQRNLFLVFTLVALFILLPVIHLSAQIRLSGFVRDSLTQEVLIGAHIVTEDFKKAVATDNNGFFSISLNKDENITISFIGYSPKNIKATSDNSGFVEIRLSPGNEIDEVVFTHQRKQNFNLAKLSSVELQNIPSLGAKPDVMKAIQLLPGIQSQNEGSSLIMVRGGNPGENLYLFDNVALIYVNHLGGFMSVFNPEMINNIDVYKGGFPAKYGGKLSSIMDIAQREGNPNKMKGTFSIGVTDASFSMEGPGFIKNSTFLVTGRKTLVDPLMALASKIADGDYIVSYGFHDINGKFSWKPNERNTLSINLYQGDDYLNFWMNQKSNFSTENSRMSNFWGNWLLSARWNHVHSPKLYSTQSLSYVRYRLNDKQKYSYQGAEENYGYNKKFHSSVQDVSYKLGYRYEMLGSWSLDFGVQSSFLQHRPNSVFLSTQSEAKVETIVNSNETALFVENKVSLFNRINIKLGARGVGYITHNYKVFDIEPRLNIDISLSKNHSINISYMGINQYSHLLFTAGNIMSNEVWVPAEKNIQPAHSEQYSAGWRGLFHKGMFDVEVNIYHKTLSNLSTYKEGYTNLMGDGNWRTKIETGGFGEAYGVEFFLRKNYGDWSGFLSYSFSKATRKFNNINSGKEFLFDYDRPHCASLCISKKLSDKVSVNAAWVFQTGLPYTPVIGRQITPSLEFDENGNPYYYEAFIYGERNSARMRHYHRLDIAVHYTTRTKRNGHKAQWSFAIYNAYNRRNPYYYYFNHNESSEIYVPSPFWEYQPLSLYQVSYFPIIPTVSYKVIFDGERKEKNENKEKRSFIRRLLYY